MQIKGTYGSLKIPPLNKVSLETISYILINNSSITMIYANHIYHIHPISIDPKPFVLEKNILHKQTHSFTKHYPNNRPQCSWWLYHEPIMSRSY